MYNSTNSGNGEIGESKLGQSNLFFGFILKTIDLMKILLRKGYGNYSGNIIHRVMCKTVFAGNSNSLVTRIDSDLTSKKINKG